MPLKLQEGASDRSSASQLCRRILHGVVFQCDQRRELFRLQFADALSDILEQNEVQEPAQFLVIACEDRLAARLYGRGSATW